jgi:hypothetical protein
MKRTLALLVGVALLGGFLVAQDPPRVRTLNDKDFFFTVPATKAGWDKRREQVRAQVLVSTGLWPEPVKTPLNPTIHGKIERDGYTIEKVFFASLPGHYVSGNLYRPLSSSKEKRPAVLCPHGHWANGRLYAANDKQVEADLKSGAEKFENGARYPLQARCVQLARMGCVVFFFDMVGVADSTAIGHTAGFLDADAELRLQNFMGLQTWNCIRAFDFLSGLEDVDAARVGVTGASGGGTQTFILACIDDRPAAAFPAVMVGTAMQGGCICENCSYLRIGTGNVEIAGCFAPRPLGLSGANDWTVDIEKKGLLELKALYKLYGAGMDERVMAKCFPQFGHNYNQVSREVMYGWFNTHLKLGQKEPITEKDFVPVSPKELSVYDAQHPRPADTADAPTLRRYLSESSDKQIEALLPKDEKSLAEYRRVFGTALRVMIDEGVPEKVEVTPGPQLAAEPGRGPVKITRPDKEAVSATLVRGKDFDGTVVVWVHPTGLASINKGGPLAAEAETILAHKAAILVPTLTAKAAPIDKNFAGLTWGYNRPLASQRTRDILTAVAGARAIPGAKTVHLVGWGESGPLTMLARALCGDAVARTAVDVNRFRFEKVRTLDDPMLLPGALKYVGLGAFAGLIAPHELFDYDHQGSGSGHFIKAAYESAGAKDKIQRTGEMVPPAKVVEWLLR